MRNLITCVAVVVVAAVALWWCWERETAQPVEGQDWTVPGLGMEFVWVKQMGTWVGKYEATNGEYRAFRSDHDSGKIEMRTVLWTVIPWKRSFSLNGNRQPVVQANFDDVCAYAEWLTERERGTGRLPAGAVYRLPQRDEWVAFAQCGDDRNYPWGNDWPPKYGNYAGEEVKEVPRLGSGIFGNDGYRDDAIVTCSVENSGRNELGLFGVGGNVMEYTLKNDSLTEFDAWRGAAWYNGSEYSLRCGWIRERGGATGRYDGLGFRLVLSRPEPK